MAQANYELLALQWQPSQKEDRVFVVSAIAAVVIALVIGLLVSYIDVPEKPQRERLVVPERVAKFINRQEKPKPPPPEPKLKPPEPKPVEVPPKPETPPPVRVERERPVPREPLTESQERAREKAAQSGLLAHLSELNDLIDTTDVNSQLKADIKPSSGEQSIAAAGHDASVITANAARGSGGVDAARYAARAGDSQLSAEELRAAQVALAASEETFTKDSTSTATESESSARLRGRSEEEVTLVFDRHKSQLQSLYNRARRNNPALKGKLILAVTIKPDGSVSRIDIVSSELNDQSLLDSLLARIRSFQFGAREADTITVNYPIEFLPY